MSEKNWWSIMQVDWEEHVVLLDTGIEMHYMTMGPEDGEPILLIHGAGDCRFAWAYVGPRVAKQGYRVYVPELRCHGRTGFVRNAVGYITIEDHAADIVDLMDKVGIESCHITGHSLGSLILQCIAYTHPEKVKSMTIIGAGQHAYAVDNMNLAEDFDQTDEDLREGYFCGIDDDDYREATYQGARSLKPIQWGYIFNGAKYFDSTNDLPRITCPVYILWGTKDIAFYPDTQVALLENLKNAPVHFEELVGQGHSAHWDSVETVDILVARIVAMARGEVEFDSPEKRIANIAYLKTKEPYAADWSTDGTTLPTEDDACK